MTTQQDERVDLIRRVEELARRFSEGWHDGIKIDASDIATLSEAAAILQADGEAAYFANAQGYGVPMHGKPMLEPGTRLYTRPQQAAHVPLTDEKIDNIKTHIAGLAFICEITDTGQLVDHVVRAVEAAHGITGKDQG